MTTEELHEKFFRLATRRISQDRAEQVLALVDDLDHVEDIAQLTELLMVSDSITR